VLGTYAVSTAQYGAPALQVHALSDAFGGEDLVRALDDITTRAHRAGLTS
jgi:hypothetical protein